jgi:uncharacterized protein (DUF58 family)
VSPAPRAVVLAAVLALALLVLDWQLVFLAAIVLVGATVADAFDARRPVDVTRTVPARLARGVPSALTITVEGAGARRVRVRQPRLPDVAIEPASGTGGLEAEIVALRRGRHVLPPVAVRVTGTLGLGRWDKEAVGPVELDVLPDLPAARRLARAVRQARFRDPGLRRRGALGLGTDFDQLRDYLPDDDIRHVNWVATARCGRPMTNQYREDTERDVVALVDAGRLMASPVPGPDGALDRTRLDVAIDAAAALAAVADAVGDRCGTVAFDDAIRARVTPRRASGDDVVRALHAVEPRPVDSDPELALRAIGTTKRALIVVLTDIVDEAAATALVEAMPYLSRRHAVVVATCRDVQLYALAEPVHDDRVSVLSATVAERVLAARDRAAARLTHAGATVVEAPPQRFSAAVVAAYLNAKSAARL